MTNERSFELGIGTFAWAGGAPDVDSVRYYHGDQIGTTRLMTTRGGSPIQSSAYTAFGERTCDLVGRSCGPTDPNHRYGYAGAWGYQAASSEDPSDPYLDFPFLHVGARYYDPSTGRFLQRDPIGISGGFNVYAYARSSPLVFLDPTGLQSDEELIDSIKRIDEMLEQARKDKAVQRIEELTVEKNRLLKKLLRSRIKNKIKKVAKKGAKKAGGKAIPLIGVCVFAYDWYKKGLKEAIREATWPFSELF